MKVLLFLAQGFETMEASAFVDIMGWAGVDVKTCALRKTVTSTFGVSVNADILLNDVCIDDYDALAIPCGFEEYGFYEDAFSEQAANLIKEFNASGKDDRHDMRCCISTWQQRYSERQKIDNLSSEQRGASKAAR